jgi:hypothetical protein
MCKYTVKSYKLTAATVLPDRLAAFSRMYTEFAL